MKKKNDLLSEYKKKRNFTKTKEPKGEKVKIKKIKSPIFVIQKHDASHLHYDFRLEINGVLKSWAIPKGPSTNPNDKRLAIETEDHPMEYAKFEGTIPEGEYGAGTVMVWDIGSYKNIRKKPIEECYEEGEIEVWLEGKKLEGGFVLFKTKFRGSKNSWIYKKMIDEKANARRNPVKTENKSALTNRTMHEIEKGDK